MDGEFCSPLPEGRKNIKERITMTTCSKCGNQFEGNFCPNCGTPAQPPQPSQNVPPQPQPPANFKQTNAPTPPPKKKAGCLKIGLIALGVLIFLGIVGTMAKTGEESSTDASNISSESSQLTSSNESSDVVSEEQSTADETIGRDEYINECETVDYTDIERNPDNYKGTKVKFTGEVVQVAEGWFNSVTIRVDCDGDIWYVTYTREEGESRILEGDSITCYGECSGIKSYTNVLGSQVTIPAMEMKYYE